MFKSKKYFVLACEYLLAALLVASAVMVRMPSYFAGMIALLWLIAFTSATQDSCVDGVYITSLHPKRQAGYIGVQGMAWNVGRIFATAVVVWLAGWFKEDLGMSAQIAWSHALRVAAGTMALLGLYHTAVLTLGSSASPPEGLAAATRTFVDTVRDFSASRSCGAC